MIVYVTCAGQVELEDGEVIGYVSVLESGTMQKGADAAADKMKRKASKQVCLIGTAGAGVGVVAAATMVLSLYCCCCCCWCLRRSGVGDSGGVEMWWCVAHAVGKPLLLVLASP